MRFIFYLLLATTAIASGPAIADVSEAERAMLSYVDAHNEEANSLLIRVVNINSGTMNAEGVREVGRVFGKEFEALGFDTEWVDGSSFQRAGHLVARRRGADGGPHLLLIGHLDTVFEPDSPFQKYAKLSETTAAGPGIVDMKGGNVVVVYALKALASQGFLEGMTITVIMTGDEERAGRPISASRQALMDAADSADIAIAFENGDNDPRTAVISRRGSSSWTLAVDAKAAHSSQIFRDDIGAGAINEAARIVSTFYRELAGEKYLTFNAGMIAGGTDVTYDSKGALGTAFGKNNVIAEHAIVTGDLRTISPKQLRTVKQRMRDIVANHLPHTTATITFDDGYPPMAPSKGNRKLLRIVDRVSRDLGFGKMTAVDPMKAGAADVAFTAERVEMAIDGLGLVGDADHTTEEMADLTTLPVQTKRAAVLFYRLAHRMY